MSTGPCAPWITAADVPYQCDDPDKLQMAVVLASSFLFRDTAKRFPGLCTRTVRPCRSHRGCGSGFGGLASTWDYPLWDMIAGGWAVGYPTLPVLIDAAWYNIPACSGNCRLPTLDEIPGPIASTHDQIQVVIDGQVLPTSAYRVAGRRSLVRVDGGTWPCSQNYAGDSSVGGDPGTWQVTYQFGRIPGEDGIIAAKLYAAEIAKALCRDDSCVLPPEIQSLAAEGVTAAFIPDGPRLETGIEWVDRWVAGINRGRIGQRARIKPLDGRISRRVRGLS